MNKNERVHAAVQGLEVDHAPVSFFGHNHLMERSVDYLAAYLIEKTRCYDWDFIKTQLNPYHYAQAWGCTFTMDPQNRSDALAVQTSHVVKNAPDMRTLPAVDPTKSPYFAEHIRLAGLLHTGFKGEIPCSHTIFSPLTVADMLAGNLATQTSSPKLIKQLMQENPQALHEGLRTITDTLCSYAKEVVRAGAAGILISTTHWACRDYMTLEDYKTFGLAYDLELFKAAREEGATLNIIHICRDNTFFELCANYPVDVISYECTADRNPSLAEAKAMTNKSLWGGVDQRKLLQTGPEADITRQVHEALNATNGKGILIGPGCAISIHTPPNNLHAVRQAVRSWKRS